MLNQIYVSMANNIVLGGVAAMLLFAIMFFRARKVAASGSTSKMVTYSVAPAAMVIASVIITGVAISVALPRLQAIFTSAPVQNALELGNTATAQLDALLSTDGLSSVGGLQVPTQASVTVDAVSSSNEAPVEVAPVVAPLEMKPLTEMFVAAQVNMLANQPANAEVGEYIVQGGDNLTKIAQRLGVDVKALCVANNLRDCNALSRGQKLIVPAAGLPVLQEAVKLRTTQAIQAPRATSNQTAYVAPKLNQSYLPPAWNVLEEGQMSLGEPANMSVSTNATQVFASFPTK